MNVSTMTNLFYDFKKNGDRAYLESMVKIH